MSTPQTGPDAELALARRRLATVAVDGLGMVGLRTATLLLRLNLGTVVLRDDASVSRGDDASVSRADLTVGYRASDAGRPRAEVVRRRLTPEADREPPTALLEVPDGARLPGADLQVITGARAGDTAYLEAAAADGGAVLPVRCSSSGIRIGPLLSSQGAAAGGYCPQCLEHLDIEHLDIEYLGSERLGLGAPAAERTMAGAADPRGPAVEAADSGVAELAELAAAAVTHQVRTLIDGISAAASQDAMLECDAGDGAWATHRLASPAECRCLTQIPRPASA